MKTHVVYVNTIPYKRYQITKLNNNLYKVKGYIMMQSIWRQMMDTTLNEAQFCRISTRIPMPKKCNPDCTL